MEDATATAFRAAASIGMGRMRVAHLGSRRLCWGVSGGESPSPGVGDFSELMFSRRLSNFPADEPHAKHLHS